MMRVTRIKTIDGIVCIDRRCKGLEGTLCALDNKDCPNIKANKCIDCDSPMRPMGDFYEGYCEYHALILMLEDEVDIEDGV